MAMMSTSPRAFSGPAAPTLIARLLRLNQLRKQRAALASLPEDRLADLGVTREQARREAHRPVWDVPGHWLR